MSNNYLNALASSKDEEFVDYVVNKRPTFQLADKDGVPLEKNKVTNNEPPAIAINTTIQEVSPDKLVTYISNLMRTLETLDLKTNAAEIHVYNIFNILKCTCFNEKSILENIEFMGLTKAWFHEYIISHKFNSLIPLYNEMYTDNQYVESNIQHMYIPEPTDEWVKEKLKEYNMQIENANIRRKAKKPAPKYAVNEIIGAKDKEGRWWLSKVLAIFEYQNSIVYYVEFTGWGDKFNEFISDGFRLNRFNPKKHRYFRPAWNPPVGNANT